MLSPILGGRGAVFLTVEPQTWDGLPQALVSLLLGNKHCTFPDLGS